MFNNHPEGCINGTIDENNSNHYPKQLTQQPPKRAGRRYSNNPMMPMPESSSNMTTSTGGTTSTCTATLPSVTLTSTSSISSDIVATPTMEDELQKLHQQQQLLSNPTSSQRDVGRSSIREVQRGRIVTDPSMSSLSLQQLNGSNRINHSINGSKMDSMRWQGSSYDGFGSQNMFKLHDSIASFIVSPPPQLYTNTSNTSNTNGNSYHHPLVNDDIGCTNATLNENMTTAGGSNNITSHHTKTNHRPSVFTTLSGSRYYMDDTNGEPMPIPTSFITHHHHTHNNTPLTAQTYHGPAVRRQSSQLTMISSVSSTNQPQNHIVLIDDSIRSHQSQQHQQQQRTNMATTSTRRQQQQQPPYPLQSRRYSMDGSSNHRRGSYGEQSSVNFPQPPPSHFPHHLSMSGSGSYHQQHQQQQQQQFRTTFTDHDIPQPHLQTSKYNTPHSYSRSPMHHFHHQREGFDDHHQQQQHFSMTMTLKSIAMIDRIPPPLPPFPPQIAGREMNCKEDIYSTPINRRWLQQKLKFSGSAIIVGTPIELAANTTTSRASIPYHSHKIYCHQCNCSMTVSKYCVAVQCPECHMIGPCESTTSKNAVGNISQQHRSTTAR